MNNDSPTISDVPSSTEVSQPQPKACCIQSLTEDLGASLSLLLVRLWLGVRSLVTGIEKFAGSKSSEALVEIDGQENAYGLTDMATQKFYALSNYHGIPPSMESQFAAEPLIPGFALTAYGYFLGPALLILGVTVLLGILPRISLFLMGLVYLSLTVGLILIKQDAGIAWLAAHIILIAFALIYADRDRFLVLGKKW
jgi:thiosulfate dehydrogenase [quinone] large subunit